MKIERLLLKSAVRLTENLSENWKRFKQHFEICMTATGIADNDESIKPSTFLRVI